MPLPKVFYLALIVLVACGAGLWIQMRRQQFERRRQEAQGIPTVIHVQANPKWNLPGNPIAPVGYVLARGCFEHEDGTKQDAWIKRGVTVEKLFVDYLLPGESFDFMIVLKQSIQHSTSRS